MRKNSRARHALSDGFINRENSTMPLALSISAAVLTTTPLYAGEPLVNEQTARSVASTSEKRYRS